MRKLAIGCSVSQGIALGKAFCVKTSSVQHSTKEISPEEKDFEIQRYKDALVKVAHEIKRLATKSNIFLAHVEVAEDPTLTEAVVQKIDAELLNAEHALANAQEEICAIFEALDDTYLRERALDVRDVCQRIMRALKNIEYRPFEAISEPVIIVAEDLTPSDTAMMNLAFVKGFITAKGGVTSHVAILAKQLNIPAIVGASEILKFVNDGEEIILNSLENTIFLHPDDETKSRAMKKAQFHREQRELLLKANHLPSVTADGRRVKLSANVGSVEECDGIKTFSCDGVGLFRTEFLYMSGTDFPTEDEQFEAYKTAVLQTEQAIVVRTFDIGGDKSLPYYPLPYEENPFLGMRSIRISLTMEHVFKTQLRALLRASAFGDIRIMYPMIISLEELREANTLLSACKAELLSMGVPFDKNISVGMMIETPAAVMLAKEFAKEVNFFSIGTNDLTQYLLAVDRANSDVASLYNSFHPAVLRAISATITAAHSENIKVSICGEFSDNELATELLVGMGVDKLSMSAQSVPKIRHLIRQMNFGKAQKLAKIVCEQSTIEGVLDVIKHGF